MPRALKSKLERALAPEQLGAWVLTTQRVNELRLALEQNESLEN